MAFLSGTAPFLLTGRRELNQVKDLKSLYSLMDKIDFEKGFLKFASENKLVPAGKEWKNQKR